MANRMNNSQILDKVFRGTNLYQLGAPNPTQVGIERSFRWLTSPNNQDMYNTFVKGLFTLIGTQLIRSREYINPLAGLKRVNLNRMQTMQEVGMMLIKAKAYNWQDVVDILEQYPPEVRVAYHSMNRQDKYPITFAPQELDRAFLTEYGLSDFLSAVLQLPINSDNVDEYNAMLDLFAKYEDRFGFFKIKVPNILGDFGSASAADIRAFAEAVRAWTGRLKICMTGLYNAYHVPTFSRPEQLYLITTPEIRAKLDVNVLAMAFNMSMTDIQTRIIEVDHIPVENAIALLVDEDWFVCGDNLYQNSDFYNPSTLTTTYWLHHWETLSVSPMMNALAFVTDVATPYPVVDVTPTGEFNMVLTDANGSYVDKIMKMSETYVRGILGWTVDPVTKGVPPAFLPTDCEIIKIEQPTSATVVSWTPGEISMANVTPGTMFNALFANSKVSVGEVSTIKLSNFKSVKFENVDHWTADLAFQDENNPYTANVDLFGMLVFQPTFNPDASTEITVSATKVETTDMINVPINSRSYIDKYGCIHLQAAAWVPGTKVSVQGTSTYNTDGVGKAEKVTAVQTFVVGEY